MKVYELDMENVVIGLKVHNPADYGVIGTIVSIDENGEARIVFDNGVTNKFVGHNCDYEVAGWERFTSFPYWRK